MNSSNVVCFRSRVAASYYARPNSPPPRNAGMAMTIPIEHAHPVLHVAQILHDEAPVDVVDLIDHIAGFRHDIAPVLRRGIGDIHRDDASMRRVTIGEAVQRIACGDRLARTQCRFINQFRLARFC